MGTGSHLEPSPTSALPVGREAWVAAGAGELAGRRRPPSWPGTLPPEQPGSGGLGICLVFLSVFAAS